MGREVSSEQPDRQRTASGPADQSGGGWRLLSADKEIRCKIVSPTPVTMTPTTSALNVLL